MSLKIDTTELFSKNFLLEVPQVYSTQEKETLSRFVKNCDTTSGKHLSSFRCPKHFSLDLEKSITLANTFRNRCDRIIVLGTGGSSLGTKAVVEALKPKIDREIYFVENLDATDLPALNQEQLRKTVIVAISKSGNTLETLLALQHYIELFTQAGLSLKDHFVAISDKDSKAPLAAWAQKNEVALLNMDPLLGGRWSVTSSVGTFPLQFCGIDAKKFVGAFEKRFSSAPCKETLRIAFRFADCDNADLNVHALWLYSSRLKEIGAWWKQLWSESLGKKKGSVYVGAFASPATGAVDQHSVLQQMAEGRKDAYSGFVYVEENHSNLEVKKLDPLFATKIGFAEGKTWHQLLKAQGVATRQSLILQGRGTYSITIKDLSEESIGDLMAFWMDVTALVGAALDVNPFDQPGVEVGKKILPNFV